MDEIIKSAITQWGSFGVILGLACWVVYNYIKESRSSNQSHEKLDNISDDLQSIKETLPELRSQVGLIDKKVNVLEQKVDEKMNFYVDNISSRMNKLEQKVDKQPEKIINQLNIKEVKDTVSHNKKILDSIKIGPKLHDIISHYIDRTKGDHMFIGLFHNGTSSTSGIPFYKFDLVAERFDPTKIKRDTEFSHMYLNSDILRFNRLPVELVQNGTLHYIIDEDHKSELMDVDDIIYRRMIGRDIKQLALSLLQDKDGIPLGFVGLCKYSYEDILLEELKNCAEEIENIYNKLS